MAARWLIVPGYFGCNQIKYVQKLKRSERVICKNSIKGLSLSTDWCARISNQPSMWRMPVKSWLNGPGADGLPIQAGRVLFYGSFSGERGLRQSMCPSMEPDLDTASQTPTSDQTHGVLFRWAG